MIDEKDIKVGLKFYLPIVRIERDSGHDRFLVNIQESCYQALISPYDTFCVESIKGDLVYCTIGIGNYLNAHVEKGILIKDGIDCNCVNPKELMKGWKKLISECCESDTFTEVNENLFAYGQSTEQVSHPSHYAWLKDLCGVEPIDICRHFDFAVGNALKYLMRKGKVDGNKTEKEKRIEDLKKAIYYLQDEIKLLSDGKE